MQYSQRGCKVKYFLEEIESHLCSLVDMILGPEGNQHENVW